MNKEIFNQKFFHLEDELLELKLIDIYDGNENQLPFYWWEIIPKNLGVPVGKISFRIGFNYHTYYNGNVGYEIDEGYRGNNYAAKACKLLIEIAKYYKMDFIYFTCDYENIASYKTIEKLGAKLIEEVKPPADYIYYYENIPVHKIYKLEVYFLYSFKNQQIA